MSPDPQDRIGVAVRTLADGVHVATPDPAILVARAAGRTGATWWRPVLSAAGVLGVLVAAALGPGLLAQPAAPADGTVLPARLADLSLLTAAVSAAPPGPALLTYVQGSGGPRWLHTTQTVVVGVDGRTYRRLDEAERRGGPAGAGTWRDAPVLLAPDGTRVAVGSVGPAVDLAVVDLRTGRTRTHRTGSTGVVEPLAWSPDGTRLAYTSGDGETAMLSVDAGGSVTIGPHATGAAFAPDGRRVALQGRPESEVEPQWVVRVVDLAGQGTAEISPTGFGGLLAGPNAWSPDGRWLVMLDNAGVGKLDCLLSFLPVDPADRTPPPAPVATAQEIALVGWAAAGRPLITQGAATGRRTIVEADGMRALSTVDGSEATHDLQAAAALLPTARVGPAGAADRGPWPVWLRLATAAGALTAAGLVWLLWSRRRHAVRSFR